MIQYVQGNIFDSPAEALVNPVNCVGTMGAGLARQFRERFPANYKQYLIECGHGRMAMGRVFCCEDGGKLIVNLPTKYHWRENSLIADVNAGLESLVVQLDWRGIHSVAIPALGCGLGGLDWADVKPLVERAFSVTSAIGMTAFVYPPEGQ